MIKSKSCEFVNHATYAYATRLSLGSKIKFKENAKQRHSSQLSFLLNFEPVSNLLPFAKRNFPALYTTLLTWWLYARCQLLLATSFHFGHVFSCGQRTWFSVFLKRSILRWKCSCSVLVHVLDWARSFSGRNLRGVRQNHAQVCIRSSSTGVCTILWRYLPLSNHSPLLYLLTFTVADLSSLLLLL